MPNNMRMSLLCLLHSVACMLLRALADICMQVLLAPCDAMCRVVYVRVHFIHRLAGA